jgi:hypothetical protein
LAQFARAGVDVDALAARIQAGRTEGGARLHKGGPGEGQ